MFVGLSLAQVIKEIRIEGTQYVPEDVVLGLINIKSGSLYSQDLVRESIRRMYRSGFFDEVAVYEERPTNNKRTTKTLHNKHILFTLLYMTAYKRRFHGF